MLSARSCEGMIRGDRIKTKNAFLFLLSLLPYEIIVRIVVLESLNPRLVIMVNIASLETLRGRDVMDSMIAAY